MGHVGGRRFSVGELHAASKTSSANGPHLNAWGFDISTAEFPQQNKTRVFGVNRPSDVGSDVLVKFLICHTTLNTHLGRFMMATNLAFLHKYDVLKTYPRGL